MGKANHRLSLNLSPVVMNTVKTIAEEEGITLTEAMRRAISMLNYIHQNKKDGNRILVEEGSTGKVREVEFVP